MTASTSLQSPREASNLQRPTLVLLGLAVLSAFIYWFGLTQPYSLLDLYRQPLLDLRKLTEGHPEKLWPLVIEFVILFALYIAAWQMAWRVHTRSVWLWRDAVAFPGSRSFATRCGRAMSIHRIRS